MRNPNRIDRTINKLRMLWHTNPDLRLGQLIANLTDEGEDIFHVEDDKIEDRIDKANQEGLTKALEKQ
jgi:uncharacterized protein YihD (DUF1040 family)